MLLARCTGYLSLPVVDSLLALLVTQRIEFILPKKGNPYVTRGRFPLGPVVFLNLIILSAEGKILFIQKILSNLDLKFLNF